MAQQWGKERTDSVAPSFDLYTYAVAYVQLPPYTLGLHILCVWLFCLQVWVWKTCMPDAHGGKKRVTNPLELELQMIMSYHVGVVNQTLLFFKSEKCS